MDPFPVDEVIFFRPPPDDCHLMIFSLPPPPYNPEELRCKFEEFGLLYEFAVMQQHTTAPFDEENLDGAAQATLTQYAHVRYFSRSSALFAKAALHRTSVHQHKISVTFYKRPPHVIASRRTCLRLTTCAALCNDILGFQSWSAGVRYIRKYEAGKDENIIQDNSHDKNAHDINDFRQRELESFAWAQRNAFACSFVAEVEFILNCVGGLHIAACGVSHGHLGERTNSTTARGHTIKRAVTNAFLNLFAQLAIIRLTNGKVDVRAFAINQQDTENTHNTRSIQ